MTNNAHQGKVSQCARNIVLKANPKIFYGSFVGMANPKISEKIREAIEHLEI